MNAAEIKNINKQFNQPKVSMPSFNPPRPQTPAIKSGIASFPSKLSSKPVAEKANINNFNKPLNKPVQKSSRIDVSSGVFKIDKTQGRFGVEKMLRPVVKSAALRSELAKELYAGRGGKGLTKAEAKAKIDKLWKQGKINNIQSKGIKRDLGVWGKI